MSILRPKDGDYIVRGIILLVGWLLICGSLFSFLGGVLAGGSGATIGFFIALFSCAVFYWRYLKLDPAVYPQKAKLCECGHHNAMHRSTLECLHGAVVHDMGGRYGTIIRTGGCTCLRFRREYWWRTNRQNPHDWSV